MRPIALIVSALLITLAACLPQGTPKFPDGPDVELGKGLFLALQAGNTAAIRGKMDQKIFATAPPLVFEQMAALFPQTPLRSVTAVSLSAVSFLGNEDPARRMNVGLQYEFDNAWLLGNVGWRETRNGDTVIETMHLQPLAMSLQEANKFELAGKSFLHYLFLGLVMTLHLFSITVLVLCLRTPMPYKRKALWCVGIIIGVGQFSLNWTNGAVSVTPLFFQFLSAGWFRTSTVAPHILTVAAPLFAIIFLWKRQRGAFAILRQTTTY